MRATAKKTRTISHEPPRARAVRDHGLRSCDPGPRGRHGRGRARQRLRAQLYMRTTDDEYGSILKEHEDDYIEQARGQGWEILSGWTGQYGYHGICLHESEFVGGGLETHIRENPGLYVVLTVDTENNEDSPTEWVVAYRAENESPAPKRREPYPTFPYPASNHLH